MAQNPKYDNDMVNLGYLNKRLGQTEESINKNNSSISQLPKNYSTPPNPPYYKDSLLCYGNKIYRCNKTKMNGNFSWNDWTVVATDDTTISDFINNTYEVEKLEIQEQIDGKIQTHYQDNDPSKDWATDLEKGRHVGDYWYNTSDNTQWRYNQITTGPTITYGWGQVNIPKSVFDTIDRKKSIYTEKPTSYKKDDLWIIEETLSNDDLPIGTDENPIAKGDWVFSIADSEVYNKEHWVKRDEDVSLSYLEQHYYTITEIDSNLEVIERNTESKITKATEEISLNISQTYTTKEEHTSAINDFDEQIGTINQTITEHKETISDLSIEVGEITSTVESIETTTKKLEIDIDNVSADFEDFKDNEYIQSIDNLQKQIDGAIQFWNGAEIPTLYNYPANEWTTENDKINHQADIYTVVQDVEGEMKQGKSYRFDKIDGVWQWIELTDNELSAVQAIAQEALDKAKANATEIGTVKTRVSSLELTDEQIKASVESIDKQIIPTATATGSNIYLEDASNNPLINLEIEGKSKQETRSGKNLYNYKDTAVVTSGITTDEDGWITINYDNTSGTSAVFKNYWTNNLDIKENTTYKAIVEIKSVSGNGSLRIVDNGTVSQFNSIFIIHDFQDVKSGDILIQDVVTKASFAESTRGLRTYGGFAVGKSGSITFRISLLEDTNITTETFKYEAYGVMPSPNYPSEIESVGAYNEETGKYEIEVKTVGKNLLNVPSVYELTGVSANVAISNMPVGRYIISHSGITTNGNDGFSLVLTYANGADRTITLSSSTKEMTITTTQEVVSFRLYSQIGSTNSQNVTTTFTNLMISETGGEYQPYRFDTSLIVLNAPLRSLPNGIKDIAYIKNNKLYVDRYVSSIVLNGSESYSSRSSAVSGILGVECNVVLDAKTPTDNNTLPNIFCNYFMQETENQRYLNNIGVSLVSSKKLRFYNGVSADASEFKTWVSTHNTQVDYELATPITEELGEIEIPKTMKGYNNITTTDDLLPIINLTYVRDTIIADYVENHVTELKLTESEIKASVESVSSSVDGLNTSINRVEEITNDNSQVINIISTNIDKTSGEVREVTTTTGFTFNADGMTIDDGSGFKAQHRAGGTYYKDGETITGQYTKDGSKQKDLELFGTYSYGKKDIDDTPMFVGQLYTDEQGEEGFGHFYNGGDY